MTVNEMIPSDQADLLRERALKSLKKKRDFHAHLIVYTLVNSCIVLIWLATGAEGFFWPMFPIAFWGIGLVMNAWDVYHPEAFSDDQIRREMSKLTS